MTSMSCEPVEEAVPNVTRVIYTSPDSTASLSSVGMGATIAIQGSGLKDVQRVKFNTVEKELNPNYVTDNNIIVTVPDDFPSEITNQVCLYTASDKEYCFDFVIEVPGPVIEDIKYQITSADQADIINLTGSSFAEVQSLTIGTPDQIANGSGTEITDYQIYNNYTLLAYNVPASFDFDQTEIVLVCVAGKVSVSVDWESSLKPLATRITNEYAIIGDTTALIGQNLASIESISFGGVDVVEYWESDNFDTLKFIVPEGVTPGETTVTASNVFGDVSVTFRYAETDQILIDFDDSTVCWDDPNRWDFVVINGDTNKWGYFRGDILPSWWDQANVIARCDESYPIFSSVADPINSLALKFEINVKNPWIGGGMLRFSFQQFVADNDGGNSDQEMIYYEWIPGYTDEVPYITDGWLTVSIPLSDFGISADYGGQLDATALKYFWLRFYHPGNLTNTLTDMDVNIDNMRLEIIN